MLRVAMQKSSSSSNTIIPKQNYHKHFRMGQSYKSSTTSSSRFVQTAAAAAAAVVGSTSSHLVPTTEAFTVVRNPQNHYHRISSSLDERQQQPRLLFSSGSILSSPPLPQQCNDPTVRLYSSRRNFDSNDNNNNNKEGIIGKALSVAKNVAKSILPSSWFKTEEEKQLAIERKRMKDDVSSSINEILKDAPFPIRALGKTFISPLLSNLASGVAQTVAQQQQSVAEVLQQAERLLNQDRTVLRAFGTSTIQVGTPFSQSSSTASINGKTTSRIEIAFPIRGDGGVDGIGRLSQSDGIIQMMEVEMSDGRRFPVDISVTGSSSRAARMFSNNMVNGDDNIIEAEIIEKKPSSKTQ